MATHESSPALACSALKLHYFWIYSSFGIHPNQDQCQVSCGLSVYSLIESCSKNLNLDQMDWTLKRSVIVPDKRRSGLPGTHWMKLATIALKWARMSLRISTSLSFSASRSIRVRSTYSRKRAPRARVSRSKAPFVLQRKWGNAQ